MVGSKQERNSSSSSTFTLKYPRWMDCGTWYNWAKMCSSCGVARMIKDRPSPQNFSYSSARLTFTSLRKQEVQGGACSG